MNGTKKPLLIGLLAIGALLVAALGWATAWADQSISAKALSNHECNDSEWHFVITQISDSSLAPASIHVVWANGASEDVSLGAFTGGVAHYTTTSNLSSTVTSATASIYDSWGGEFNLSHGPCGGEATPTNTSPPDTDTPTPTNTPTATDTATATDTVVPPVDTDTPTPTDTLEAPPSETPTPTDTEVGPPPEDTATATEEHRATPTGTRRRGGDGGHEAPSKTPTPVITCRQKGFALQVYVPQGQETKFLHIVMSDGEVWNTPLFASLKTGYHEFPAGVFVWSVTYEGRSGLLQRTDGNAQPLTASSCETLELVLTLPETVPTAKPGGVSGGGGGGLWLLTGLLFLFVAGLQIVGRIFFVKK